VGRWAGVEESFPKRYGRGHFGADWEVRTMDASVGEGVFCLLWGEPGVRCFLGLVGLDFFGFLVCQVFRLH
jgi:hypothetical protein